MDDHSQDRPLIFRTSNKLALQYSLLYSLLVILVFAFAYFLSRYEITDWALDWMRDDVPSFQTIFEEGGQDGLKHAIQYAADINAEKSKLYGLFDSEREYISGSILRLPSDESALASYRQLGLDEPEEGEEISYWLRVDQVGEFLVVQGTSDEVISELLEALGISLLIGFFLVLALGLMLGRRVGRITENRVSEISKTLKSAASGDFSARINPQRRGDDLWLVEQEIDWTLGQLSNAVEAQRQVSVDIAHDLRSPLQRVRQNVERLQKGGDFEASKLVAIQAIDELNSTFQSLLDISGLSGAKSIASDRVDVEELAQLVEELYLPEASSAGIQFRTFVDSEAQAINGDKNLLVQMTGNLVDNCLKYCEPGDEVILRILKRDGAVTVRVEDTGPGVPSEHHERIFNRFHRVDHSRNSPGVGLGLALVRAIAAAHGASARLVPSNAGTIIEVVNLPT